MISLVIILTGIQPSVYDVNGAELVPGTTGIPDDSEKASLSLQTLNVGTITYRDSSWNLATKNFLHELTEVSSRPSSLLSIPVLKVQVAMNISTTQLFKQMY